MGYFWGIPLPETLAKSGKRPVSDVLNQPNKKDSNRREPVLSSVLVLR